MYVSSSSTSTSRSVIPRVSAYGRGGGGGGLTHSSLFDTTIIIITGTIKIVLAFMVYQRNFWKS